VPGPPVKKKSRPCTRGVKYFRYTLKWNRDRTKMGLDQCGLL